MLSSLLPEQSSSFEQEQESFSAQESGTSTSTQTEAKIYVDVGTQTSRSAIRPVYRKDAMTSTIGLRKAKTKSMKVQVNIKSPKKLRGNVNTQFPTPKKKRRNFKISEATEVDTSGSESDDTCSDTEEDSSSDDMGITGMCESRPGDIVSGDIVSGGNVSGGIVSGGIVSGGGIEVSGLVVEDRVLRDSEIDDGVVNNGIVNSELNEPVNSQMNQSVNSEMNQSVNSELNTTLDESFTESENCFDEDYIPSEADYTSDETEDQVSSARKSRSERTFIVYESKLYELLKYCPNCGGHVDSSVIEEVPNTGSQLHLKISCFNDCLVDWKSQPQVGALKGLGNLFLSTGIAFSGLPFEKFRRFAWLINLKF